MATGSSWRSDAGWERSTRPTIPRVSPALHSALSGEQSAVSALHVPGALQVRRALFRQHRYT